MPSKPKPADPKLGRPEPAETQSLAVKLNALRDRPGARRSAKRVGRGIGSGKGKTSGRGFKGQKSRSGTSIKGFEGGQTPLYRRLPKRGFVSRAHKTYTLIALDVLQSAISAGRLDAKKTIDISALYAAGIVDRPRCGVKLLAARQKTKLSPKLNVRVASASASAKTAIEENGGTLTFCPLGEARIINAEASQIRRESQRQKARKNMQRHISKNADNSDRHADSASE